MTLRLVRSPSASFKEMLLANVRPVDRKRLEAETWGAVGDGKLPPAHSDACRGGPTGCRADRA